MSSIPAALLYTKDHEWLKVDGDTALIGITDHAQGSLGDITFVELPSVGDAFETGESFGVVESVKAASDLYLPVSGEIVEINSALEDTPETVNNDPYENGWIVRVKLSDKSQLDSLMNADAYKSLV